MSTVLSRAPAGLAAPLVRVEVHLSSGLPAFAMVGLPETVVRESRERVRSSLLNAGFEFPPGRITVNLSPADLPKEGGRFDLPIAVGILAAGGRVPCAALTGREFYGELALSGELRETAALLPALIAGLQARHELILPAANAFDAALMMDSRLKLARNLVEVCDALNGGAGLAPVTAHEVQACATASEPQLPDLCDVRGQFAAKRALEIAAAGAHGLLMIGPPGAGKTLLAQCLPGLLPPLSPAEQLEIASVESAAGRRPVRGLSRPFRHPQHTASVAALIGGASLRPGELSLAHLGVLFLDELPEFAHDALEALREPLESGIVVLCRARRTTQFPARFQLVAAMNPCPCGYAGDPRGRCGCSAAAVARYRQRLSGPLVDRIDMHVELAGLPVGHLMDAGPALESSAVVAARVIGARERQIARQGLLNSRLNPRQIERHCRLGAGARSLLKTAIDRLGLSARAYHRVLKLARTCADLADQSDIRLDDVSEAVNLRALDRGSPATDYLLSETM